MIDRKHYLELCQKVAVLKSRVFRLKDNIPSGLVVVYGGIKYYPEALEISFDRNGAVINTAILHSMVSNSHTRANLKEVSLYEN